MSTLLRRLWKDDSGQGLTEYVLIIALVAVGLILVLTAFRDEIGRLFDDSTDQLEAAGASQYQPGTGGGAGT
jgi:pilus assembly protein Flp/PilA